MKRSARARGGGYFTAWLFEGDLCFTPLKTPRRAPLHHVASGCALLETGHCDNRHARVAFFEPIGNHVRGAALGNCARCLWATEVSPQVDPVASPRANNIICHRILAPCSFAYGALWGIGFEPQSAESKGRFSVGLGLVFWNQKPESLIPIRNKVLQKTSAPH